MSAIRLLVRQDDIDEPDERVVVSITAATNATIGGFYGLGAGVITDSDPPPVIVPGQASLLEGDSGTRTLRIPVSLSAPSAQTVTASWITGNHTATASSDYVPASGVVTFAPGETEQRVLITINGDVAPEPDELMWVSFRQPVNATIGGFLGLGFGTILNDDPTSAGREPMWIVWRGLRHDQPDLRFVADDQLDLQRLSVRLQHRLEAKSAALGSACVASGGTGYGVRGIDATSKGYFTCGQN